MLPELRRYWRDPGYWRWLWANRLRTRTKGLIVALVVLVGIACALGGYLFEKRVAAADAAGTFTTQRVVTVRGANGQPHVVTQVQTVTRSGGTKLVTVGRNGHRVVVRAPADTVTAEGPVQRRVVTKPTTDTVVRTSTANRSRTVTAPGSTVTGPGSTVTGPGTTETVTAAGTTETVTQPARTVTETTTREVTTTVETTVTEPVTVTETVTVTTPRG